MTKQRILDKLLNFGVEQEIELLTRNNIADAYKFSYQRRMLIKLLFKCSKKEFLRNLYEMVEFTVVDNGYWLYNPDSFVHNDDVRFYLVELIQDIERN